MILIYSYLIMVTSVYCSYHEMSQKTLIPAPGSRNIFFGYSIGFQSNFIVIGAPHEDKIGQMYKCSVNNILESAASSHECNRTELNAEKLIFDTIDSRNQPVTLWSSIASITKFVTTCTALFGECFIHNTETNTSVNNIKPREEYIEKIKYQGRWSVMSNGSDDSVLVMRFLADSLKDQKNLEVSDINQTSRSMNKLQTWKMEDGSSFLGHAIGNYFSDVNTSIYAVSSFTADLKGRVRFLTIDPNNIEDGKVLKVLKNAEKGAMYGSVLHSEDFDGDGFSELLVAAPSYATSIGYECGAVYIYVGGDKDKMDKRKNMLYSVVDGGRFGTSIATTDIDGDGVPELFISAPFDGFGKVYIFSGVDIRQLMNSPTRWKEDISEMTTTVIVGDKYKGFGSALYILPDIDDNGCNELLIGSPYADNVKLYRCVPTANVSVSSYVEGYETVPENVTEFIINICIHISYPIKPSRISTILTIENNIKRKGVSNQSSKGLDLKAEDSNYKIQLSNRTEKICKRISIDVASDDPGRYAFSTRVGTEKNITNIKEFDTSWVNVNTSREQQLEITRGCNGAAECVPKFHMTLIWTINEKGYNLGENSLQYLKITVQNTGTSANNACIKIRTFGLHLTRSDILYLPKPFKYLSEFHEEILLDTNSTTNLNDTLQVTAELYKRCDDDSVGETQRLKSTVFMDESKISLNGSVRNLTVKSSGNATNEITTEHQYNVTNGFAVSWRNLHVNISVQKNDYLIDANIQGEFEDLCKKVEGKNSDVNFICQFDLKPLKSAILFIAINVLKDIAMEHVVEDRVKIQSKIYVRLLPISAVKIDSLENEIIFETIKFYNNKNLMIIICGLLGLLFLALIIYGLYKVGFFKRKEMAKLNELKKEIRRQSVRRNTSVGVEAMNEDLFENISMCDEVFGDDVKAGGQERK